MSRDIRSFFTIKKEKKIKDEDSDVIPESPEVLISKKKNTSRKRRRIQDSDEDSPTKKKITPPKLTLKEVKTKNLFDNGPIKRTKPLVEKSKKKTETGIHSDEEFEQSLLQIDEADAPDIIKVEKSTKIEKEGSKELKSNAKNSKQNKDKSPQKEYESIKIENIEIDNHVNNKTAIKSELQNKSNKRKLDKSNNESVLNNSTSVHKANDFSVFLNSDNEGQCDTETKESKQKKRKLDKSLNESVLSDEEKHERRRYSAALYQKYLNRTGPKHLGTKEIPEGAPNCLKDYVFLLTGVLDSFEKDDVVAAIAKYGGCVKTGISKKITHVIAGDDAGPAKLAKAQELGVKIIHEDGFLQMIKESTVKKSKSSHDKKDTKKKKDRTEKDNSAEKSKKIHQSNMSIRNEKSISPVKHVKKIKPKIKSEVSEICIEPESNTSGEDKPRTSATTPANLSSLLWVDKYKPQTLRQIVGQQGDASNVNKLLKWLTKWYINRKAKLPKPSPWAKNDDGGYYRAALLSGPPGVGKTTTVSLVCKELGFDMVEFNASDTRSKNLIKEQIGELLSSTSLSGYAKGNTGKGAVSKKHVLVMDEVDGMAGNEDRGGLQELISLIKSSSVPVICMCNDRNSDKMRTLANYCYDLRFSRPRVEQIKAAMMSVCFKEGLKVPGEVMSQLVVSAGQDLRQTLTLLSLWAADAVLDRDKLSKETGNLKKDVKMGPWDAIRKVFSAEAHKGMTIHDKADLFFSDYSIMPLFVQENYLSVSPHCPKHEVLSRMSKAADSISLGDIVEAKIRNRQAWNLLPLQAMFSSVIPGQVLEGHLAAQIQFPSWLGKNSKANKMHRLCQEIHAHTRLSISGSKSAIYLDYAKQIRDAIVAPLIKDKVDGVDQSLAVLESYNLLRDDLDSLVELSVWPGQRNPTVLIDPKVKAAMTRAYNKKATVLPYAPGSFKKVRCGQDDEYTQDDEEMEDNSDTEHDTLIKKKIHKVPAKPSTSKAGKGKQSSTSPSKGKGKQITKARKKIK